MRVIKLGLKQLEDESLVKVVGHYPKLERLISHRLFKVLENPAMKAIDLLIGSWALNFPWAVSPYAQRVLRWVPDLQDRVHPHYFSDQRLTERQESLTSSLKRGHALYFSSSDAMNTFTQYYEKSENVVGKVRFTASLDDFNEAQCMLNKMECSDCNSCGYIYLPNQWWKHKNHDVALEAFEKYQSNGGKRHLILTGPEYDDRFPKWHDDLLKRIAGIEGLHTLGMVSRSLQFGLYYNADILLQPSLFEGWSTTIEEALYIGTPILASDLEVNIEQLASCVDSVLFKRNSSDDLAEKLQLKINRIPYTELVERRIQRHRRFLDDLAKVIVSAENFTQRTNKSTDSVA